MNNQDIFNLIEGNHKHTVELMSATKTAINAEVKATADMLKHEVLETQRRQDITNGRVGDLEKDGVKTKKMRSTLPYKLGGVILAAIVLTIVLEEFGILEFLNLIK